MAKRAISIDFKAAGMFAAMMRRVGYENRWKEYASEESARKEKEMIVLNPLYNRKPSATARL